MGGGLSLLDLVPALRGHFGYESGHHGDVWLDLDSLFLRPGRLAPYLSRLASLLAGHGVDVVAGPLVGGALAGYAVATRLDVAFCHSVRDGSSYEIPGTLRAALEGRRVAVVDDAVNAGSAVLGTAAAVRAAGGRLTSVGALLALGDAPRAIAARAGVPFEHLATPPLRLRRAADCPSCAAGLPLDRPPS